MSAIIDFFTGGSSEQAKKHGHKRFESFAPVRQGGHVKWYVDGKDYFFAVSEALSHAQNEIFIEDWWLSPEVYLRRPPNKYEDYRLDRLLKKKAEEGVKIYVVVYKEMPKAMELDSAHSKETLSSLHENIVVQRHPDHDLGGVFFWAHHEKICVIDRHIAFIGGLDLCFGRYDTHYHQVVDFHRHSSYVEVWPGQDYSNPRVKDFVEVRDYLKVLVDKKETARMPWHDVSIGIVGRPVQDVAKHFIQRWNFIKKSKAENNPRVKVLVDKSDAQHDRENPPQLRTYHAFGKTHRAHHYEGSCNVQILRSSAKWSHDIETEHSILNAYIETIKNAKHFIYIENQFFVTATKPSNNYAVKNQIGAAIVERVLRAAKHNEKFRIIVCMPLLPSFEAEIESRDAGTLRLVMHYQYMSISRGGDSIFDRIKEAGVDPAKYISFYALRAYDRLVPSAATRDGQVVEEDVTANYVTEELYIHTKLLIADDRQVIIGSANLNDRSQLGDHDSEIAAYIEDHEWIDSHLAGEPYKASKFAATLRRALFKEHLGLATETDFERVTLNSHPPPHPIDPNHTQLTEADRIVEDPTSDEFYNYWQKIATTNTESFRAVFHCVPDDTVTSWTEYKNFVPAYAKDKIQIGHVAKHELTLQEVKEHLGKIHGHLVHFPTRFMEKEKLEGSVLDPLTPMEIFI